MNIPGGGYVLKNVDETDEALIRAFQGGDLSAFDSLYARYESWVVSLAWRLTGNREDALDVLQETFAYFFRKLPGFVLRSKFKTFLYPVVRHLSIDRREKAKREMPLRAEGREAPPAAGPETGEVARLLSKLSEEQQEVVRLRFVDGLELREIAEALEIPVGTVKSRLHTAIATLRARTTYDA